MKETTPASMWNSRYANPEYQFGVEPNDFLVEVVDKIPKGKTLCLADGEGRNGVYLASLGHNVTSVDLAAEGLAKALKLASKQGVVINTIEANLLEFDLGESVWDSIISIFFHLPSAVRRTLHAKVAKALKPGGVLVLEAYTPAQLEFATGGPPSADSLMTLNLLHADFPDLQFVHAVEREREVIEGTLHNGHAAVVQVLARKPTD